ncbi:MAG: helix-turn-helix transcriptional regulator [Balneolaceae bacterium]|nr:helix-turn-helix transcriptional regulator [Balneolaceae bacterium]
MRQIDKNTQRLIQEYKTNLEKPDSEWPADVRNAVRCIHDHLFDHKLTVGWVEDTCQISNHNFSGKFKFYTGLGAKQYMLEHRLEAAKKLLIDNYKGGLSISEIGYEVGFSSYASFNKAFNKSFGLPPGQWLKEKVKG